MSKSDIYVIAWLTVAPSSLTDCHVARRPDTTFKSIAEKWLRAFRYMVVFFFDVKTSRKSSSVVIGIKMSKYWSKRLWMSSNNARSSSTGTCTPFCFPFNAELTWCFQKPIVRGLSSRGDCSKIKSTITVSQAWHTLSTSVGVVAVYPNGTTTLTERLSTAAS